MCIYTEIYCDLNFSSWPPVGWFPELCVLTHTFWKGEHAKEETGGLVSWEFTDWLETHYRWGKKTLVK